MNIKICLLSLIVSATMTVGAAERRATVRDHHALAAVAVAYDDAIQDVKEAVTKVVVIATCSVLGGAALYALLPEVEPLDICEVM